MTTALGNFNNDVNNCRFTIIDFGNAIINETKNKISKIPLAIIQVMLIKKERIKTKGRTPNITPRGSTKLFMMPRQK